MVVSPPSWELLVFLLRAREKALWRPSRVHQLFCGVEEHRLVTLALVKEVVNSVHLTNQASADLVEAALLNLRLVRSTATRMSVLCG